MQTFRNINAHVVNTDIYIYIYIYIYICIYNIKVYLNVYGLHNKQTYQCEQNKLKMFTKHDSRNTKVSIFLKKNIFCSHVIVLVKTSPLMYQLLM